VKFEITKSLAMTVFEMAVLNSSIYGEYSLPHDSMAVVPEMSARNQKIFTAHAKEAQAAVVNGKIKVT